MQYKGNLANAQAVHRRRSGGAGEMDTSHKCPLSREPYEVKACAMSRTERIATRGGRSSEQMTPRRPPDLDPKGRGDKRMVGKRGTAEDGYAVAPQRLNDRAKAGLPEPQCPVVELHTRW
jgi:hypothetical protein